MTFKRVMVLGVMASALVFTGCQDRNRGQQDLRAQSGVDQTQQQPATGGTGSSSGSVNGTGGSGSANDQGTSGALDQNQDTSGPLNDQQSGVGGAGMTPSPMTTGARDAGTGGMDAGMR
jgi:hypothetical protein